MLTCVVPSAPTSRLLSMENVETTITNGLDLRVVFVLSKSTQAILSVESTKELMRISVSPSASTLPLLEADSAKINVDALITSNQFADVTELHMITSANPIVLESPNSMKESVIRTPWISVSSAKELLRKSVAMTVRLMITNAS